MLIFLKIRVLLWKRRDKTLELERLRQNPVILYISPKSVHGKSLEAGLLSSPECT